MKTRSIHSPSKSSAVTSIVRMFGGCVLFLAILMAGCSTDVSIAPQTYVPRLVVNSYLNPGHYMEVSVRSSVSPLSAAQYVIPEGVQVYISDLTRGDALKLYREDSTWIAPQTYPKPGHSYALKVEAPNYETVYAYATIPEIDIEVDLVIKDFELNPSQTTSGKNNLSYTIALDLNGLETQYPYIHAIFRQRTALNVGSIGEPEFQEFIYPVSPEFPSESGFVEHIQEGVLVDLGQVADPNHLMFSFRDYTLDEFEEIGELLVEVRFVSGDYFSYFNSLTQQLYAREDPFAEPVQVYSNVEDGLGCFGAFSSQTFAVSFPE